MPPDNCDDALDAQNGDMTLVRADTMHDAVTAIESWVDDPDATLPSCEKEGVVTDFELDLDPALAAAVLEIENHIAESGWDQPARLYALVETARLVRARAGSWPRRWASTRPPPRAR